MFRRDGAGSSSYALLRSRSDSESSLDLVMDTVPMAEPPVPQDTKSSLEPESIINVHPETSKTLSWLDWFRSSYHGALFFNTLAFLLPAVYGTLSRLWIASIDESLLSTADAYTYFSIVIEVLNEGIPRAAWSTIGSGDTTRDTTEELIHRLSLTYTLITVQSVFGFLLSVVFLAAAPRFVEAFVPGKSRPISVTYIRILAFDSLASTLNTAVSLGTRALDKPDVPLLMSSVQTLIQIFLELALMSRVHVKGFNPTILTSATIKLVCDLTGATVGLAYFLYLSRKAVSRSHAFPVRSPPWFSYECLKILVRPGRWTFAESAVRNAIYLWQIHGVVAMGQSYTTAWGVFNNIRWGLIMVPVSALEATSNAFVGHRWGIYQKSKLSADAKASWKDLRFITAPAFKSALIALLIECPLCLALSVGGAKPFAKFLSKSDEVATITAMMWRSIDWCYICYGISTQLATILLSTQTRWYLYQSLASNILYALPWAIALPRIGITADTAWKYHKWVFGGSLVVSLGIIIFVDTLWALNLRGWRVLSKRRLWRSRVEV